MEDVRHWHPGQDWIWEAGGMGVFDPGINALSIATHILPPFFLTGATLSVPENRQAPIAADLRFADAAGTPIRAVFDWRQTGPQTWDIRVETEDGFLVLSRGGAVLTIDGRDQPLPPEAEYRGLYDRFAALVRSGASDVDLNPLTHVADAFLRGERRTVEAFTD
jgi:D-galactose 1-dehydrogenase